jgi:NAD+ kinase
MKSPAGSTPPSVKAPRRVTKAAVVTHGKAGQIGPALARLQSVAREADVELVFSAEESDKHGLVAANGDETDADIALVLGGDGTMLRALARFLGTGVPVVGVNFGRVGFLSSIPRAELEAGVARIFAGEYEIVELATLEVEAGDGRRVALNDAVVSSAELGRMIELEWAVGGEVLGNQPCDGLICSTPSGSTAYNLSNGGPVLMWGIDAMAVTFVAPHSLHARPLVVPRGRDLIVWNRTSDVDAAVLVDGHRVADAGPGGRVVMRLGPDRSLLATLPEASFVQRYRQSFAT